MFKYNYLLFYLYTFNKAKNKNLRGIYEEIFKVNINIY